MCLVVSPVKSCAIERGGEGDGGGVGVWGEGEGGI